MSYIKLFSLQNLITIIIWPWNLKQMKQTKNKRNPSNNEEALKTQMNICSGLNDWHLE